MNKNLIFVIVVFLNNLVIAQDMPLKFEAIPSNVQYEFISTKEIFEETESDLYGFSITDKNYFVKITTNGIPDMVMIPYNSYGGGELYRKLEDKTYLRILECRKNGKKCEVYVIDKNNISTRKILSVESEEPIQILLMGCSLYWIESKFK